MRENEILKIYGTDYKDMTKYLLEQARLEERICGKDSRIGIKPNLVSPSPACQGATTHPEVVAGIIEYLRERGFCNLVIMEGSWVGDWTEEAVTVCGYDRLAQEYGVKFIDTQKESSHERDCKGMKLNICDCVDQVDFLINVPVLKGHCQTKITCALKNLKGLIPNREKRRFHSLGLHRPIAHLNTGIRQDFIVVDHICGDLDFEDGGNPVVRNCVMAACDPVLVDAHVCTLLHYDISEVPYVGLAEELGVGSADLSRAEITVCGRNGAQEGSSGKQRRMAPGPGGKRDESGEHVSVSCGPAGGIRGQEDAPDSEEELPLARRVVAVSDAVEEVESCSACYGYLIPALDRLREEGLLEKLEDKICIGQGYRGKTGKIGVGQCTSGFEYSVKGCPPTENQIYEFLKAYIGSCQEKRPIE